jgi:hypothetical protein
MTPALAADPSREAAMRALHLLPVVLVAVTGCSAFSPSQRAYYDGCQSGYVDADYGATYIKDEGRFEKEPDYRNNWQAGYDACYSRARDRVIGGGGGGGR